MPKSIVNGALLALGLAAAVAGDVQADTRIKRGAYLAAIMDCGGCHTPGVFFGKPDQSRYLGGSEVGFFIPELGYFYPPNLTPDPETGLGKWSEADIIKALRTGERPDGRVLVPAMPWQSYAKITDEDARALVAYLKSLKPVRHQVPALKGAGEKPAAPYLKVTIPE